MSEFLKAYWSWVALILVIIAAIALYDAATSLEMLLPGGGES